MSDTVIKAEWVKADTDGASLLELATFIPEMKSALREAWTTRGDPKRAETRIYQAERRSIPQDQLNYLLVALKELETA